MAGLIIIDEAILEELRSGVAGLNEMLEELCIRYGLSYEDAWLDNQKACEYLDITPRTLQTYRQQGQLPYTQIGGKVYYKPLDIDEFLKSGYKKNKK